MIEGLFVCTKSELKEGYPTFSFKEIDDEGFGEFKVPEDYVHIGAWEELQFQIQPDFCAIGDIVKLTLERQDE